MKMQTPHFLESNAFPKMQMWRTAHAELEERIAGVRDARQAGRPITSVVWSRFGLRRAIDERTLFVKMIGRSILK
jgi:hypothetical protein